MLKITNASAVSDQSELLNNIDLEIKENKLHLIIGASGAGKTSIAKLLAGNSEIIQTSGTVSFNRRNITNDSPEARAKLGIFVSYQDPPFIDGITNIELTKLSLESIGDIRTSQEIERDYRVLSLMLGLGSNHGNKFVNDHGSLRSETLKNEMLQMLMMNPKVAVLDSIDNDLDPEDLDIIAEVINGFIAGNGKMCVVLTNNKQFVKKLESGEISILSDKTISTPKDSEEIKRIINDDNSQLL
jgi:Fe-S cluster assembly ATP-binding protein